jgi:hypothetical protein
MKHELFEKGLQLHKEFCEVNKLTLPVIEQSDIPRTFKTCAFYRPHKITICVAACATIGTAAQA